ncbi:hypothetical protein J5N97_025847 [Dioscorea zingiberensis]|uniref:Peptidase M16 N-terminal domain-containing protein n=1 Tax=Dioscorea zingiberensis TaxID=325984 RepID=A0A9D5C1I6_9LILI|nr:hypothetical protein J5N97_025847 [Dioscorea zingiberensis]
MYRAAASLKALKRHAGDTRVCGTAARFASTSIAKSQERQRSLPLPNGVKIASETSVNLVASIGVYVDSGSIYETPASFGASHLLERMAFKSTTNRSHLGMDCA